MYSSRRGRKSVPTFKNISKLIQGAFIAVFVLSSFVSFISQAVAEVPPAIINYQGRLRDNTGTPIDVTTTIQFSIYNHLSTGASTDVPSAGGPLLWKETYNQGSGSCAEILPDAQGYFTVNLGNCASFPSYLDFSTGTYYLALKVGADAEATPRVILATHPYAFNSHRVDGLHATTTATAGQLLALDNNSNFNIVSGTFGGASISLSSSTATSSFGGNLSVTGLAQFSTATINNLLVTGNATFDSLDLTNVSSTNITASGFLNISGLATFGNVSTTAITASGYINTNDLTVTGQTTLANASSTNLTVSSNLFLPSFTQGSVVFAGLGGLLTQDNDNFFFDDSNNRLGIGTSAPVAKLDVNGDLSLTGANRYINFGSATSSDGFGFRDNEGRVQYRHEDSEWKDIGSKIGRVINVAKEGGDYSDLSLAFAAANASTEDVIVNIYPGIYDVSSTLAVTSTHFKGIRGMSKESVIIRPTTDMVATPQAVIEINFPATTNFGMRLVTIDATDTVGFKTTNGCDAVRITSEGDDWIDFEQMMIRSVNRGFVMEVANMVNFYKSEVRDTGDISIFLDNGASLQVENSYFEEAENYFVKALSTTGSTSFYMVGSEFGSNLGVGTGIQLENDGTYAEVRYSNLWGLDYNVRTYDDSEINITNSYLQAAVSKNIDQHNSSKVTAGSSIGAFSAEDMSIEDATNVYFNAVTEGDQMLIMGKGVDTDQDLFKIYAGKSDDPKLSYRSDYYYGIQGLIYSDLTPGSEGFFGVESQGETASIFASNNQRDASVQFGLFSALTPGVYDDIRGWNINRTGADATLVFKFINSDIGDGKPYITSTNVMALDGFNQQLIMDGGAVFNTSSGNFDFQIKGVANPNLFFVQGGTDRVGIGTSTPTATLDVDGSVRISATTTLNGALSIIEGGSSPTFYTSFLGGDQSGNIFYTLPTTSANGILLNNNGILSWNNTNFQLTSEKNQANGYVGLDASGTMAVAQIPDVLFRSTHAGVEHEYDITSNGDGTVNVPDNTASFYVDNGRIQNFAITGSSSLSLVDKEANYIVADHNTNSFVVLLDDTLIDYVRYLPYAEIYRSGNNAHVQIANLKGNGEIESLHNRIAMTDRYARESGLDTITVSTSLQVSVSAGVAWAVNTRFPIPPSGTSTRLFENFHDGTGAWTISSSLDPKINNTQYDSGLGMTDLTDGYYTINYIYRGVEHFADDHMYIVYSNQQYPSLDLAKAAGEIGNLPDIVKIHTILVGRVIVQKNSTNFLVQSAFTDMFAGVSSVNVHSSLSSLLADDHTQYAMLAGRADGQTIIGSTSSTGNLLLRTTSGNAVSGSDMIFQTGNNGSVEAIRVLYDGVVNIGSLSVVNQLTVSGTSTINGPFLMGSYMKFSSLGDNYLYFANSNDKYLKWDNVNNRFVFSDDLTVSGTVTSTGLVVSGVSQITDLIVENSITLGGVSRNTWPASGGGTGGSWWATTTNNVGYPDLNNPYAITIGTSATTSESIFEVLGNTKLRGDLTIVGNATSTNFFATNLDWLGTASGTNIMFTHATGTDLTLSGLAVLDGGLKVGDMDDTMSGAIKFTGNDFLGYDGSYWRSLTNLASVRGEATGFPNQTDSAISFNDGARTFSLSPVGASFDFYFQGAKYTKSTAQTTVIDDAEGLWYIYFNSSGVLQHSQAQPDEKDTVNVSMVYWDATNDKAILLGEYRSGLTMDADTHAWIRMTVGPRYSSGLTLSGDIFGDGTDNRDAQVALTGGVIFDEDLAYTIVADSSPTNPFEQDLGVGAGGAITSPAKIPLYYRSGVAGVERKKAATNFPVYENSGSRISYNAYSGGWVTSTVPDGSHVAVWLFATHNINEPIVAVLGQRVDDDVADARLNNTYSSVSLDSLPYQNMKVLYRVIYKTDDTYTNAVKAKIVDMEDYRDVTTLPSGNYVASAHGALTGLNQDDHLQYFLSGGRSSEQTLHGGIDAGGNLILDSTFDSSKGSVFIQPLGGGVIIGSSTSFAPNSSLLSLQGNATVSSLFNVASSSGLSYLHVSNDGNIGVGTTTPGSMLTVVGTSSLRTSLPENDLVYDLGSVGLRWNNVYASTATLGNLTVSNPVFFANLSFTNATGTNLVVNESISSTQLIVSGTSTLSGQTFLGNDLQFTSASNNNIYFGNDTNNYLSWNEVDGRFEMSPALSINGVASTTALIVNGNATTTGNIFIAGAITANNFVSLTTSTFDNLLVSGYISSTQLFVTGTSTLTGPALLGDYLKFTTAGDNNIYFNNGTDQYLKWNDAVNGFKLSNGLSIDGNVTSTGLVVDGTGTMTNLIVTSSITLGGVTRNTWPTGGGTGGDSIWSTTTDGVAYPDLAAPYAIVINNSVTTSNSIFEVNDGNSQFGGDVNITGNATSSRFFTSNLLWTSATGTNLSWTNSIGTNSTLTNATSTNFYFTNANGSALNWINATGTNLVVSNLLSANRLSVTNTSTLAGPVLMGGYARFTTAGNNYLYFNNGSSNYMQWDNANSRFVFSNALSVNGIVSSTALQINGNASTTGNLYVGSQLNVIATSTFTTTSIRSLLLADGTSSSPSLTFASDKGVGLYHPTGDGLAFSTGALERMRILSNGNIGIGTSTPGSKLTIYNGDIQVVSGTANMILGSGAFPNHVASTDSSGLTTNANGVVKSGLITEVNGALLSFAINATQLGNRNTSTIGAIFRLDTRAGSPFWSLKRQPAGGNTEVSDFQISTEGDMGVGAGHASDANSFAGQLHIIPKNSTTTALVVQGAVGQSNDYTQWLDSSSTVLASAKKLSDNFGMAMETGAFISQNAYIGEEFARDRSNVTADNAFAVGDNQQFAVDENGTCTWGAVDDVVNGIWSQTTANSNGNSCLMYHANSAGNAHLIFDSQNLPITIIKFSPTHVGLNDRFWVGISDLAQAQSSEPDDGIYFNYNTATGDFQGTTGRNGVYTRVNCEGVGVDVSQMALVKFEVVSSNGSGGGSVKFYVDSSAANGIQWQYCGESTTNIPTVGMTSMLMSYSGSNGRGIYVDYFRVWQDDSLSNEALVWEVAEDSLENSPEPSFEEKTVLDLDNLFTAVSSTWNKIGDLTNLYSEQTLQIAQANGRIGELASRLGILDLTASSTSAMLAGLDNRIVVLESTASTTNSSLVEIRDQISNIQYSISTIVTTTLADTLQGNAVDLNTTMLNLVVEESAEFKGKVTVKEQVILGTDTIGQAKILAGAVSATITFANPYENLPVITVTPIGLHNLVYGVDSVSTSSFSILIDPVQGVDVLFNWHAFGSTLESKIFVSDGKTSPVNIVLPFEAVSVPVVEESEQVPVIFEQSTSTAEGPIVILDEVAQTPTTSLETAEVPLVPSQTEGAPQLPVEIINETTVPSDTPAVTADQVEEVSSEPIEVIATEPIEA